MVDASNIAINWWAILACGVASMVVGFIWYMPKVMGNMWMAAIQKTPEDIAKGWQPSMFLKTFALALLTAYILSHFTQLVRADTFANYLTTAFFIWLGFVFTVMAMNIMYEGKSSKLLIVNGLYQLITLQVMAAILYYWQ